MSQPFQLDPSPKDCSMTRMHAAIAGAKAFASSLNLDLPIFLAPMAGACPPSLSIGIANQGGLGSCAALLMSPSGINGWASDFRSASSGQFQINLWIPDPPPHRDTAAEDAIRNFLGQWGPAVARQAADTRPPDFAEQCEAMLEICPPVISSVMGLYPPDFVRRMKNKGIKWFANISTVTEARAAQAAGADAIVAQGMEAGGHRGTFNAAEAEATMTGLFSLLPAVVDAVDLPVIATGGIAP